MKLQLYYLTVKTESTFLSILNCVEVLFFWRRSEFRQNAKPLLLPFKKRHFFFVPRKYPILAMSTTSKNQLSFKKIESSKGRAMIQDSEGFRYMYHHGSTDRNGIRTEYWRCRDLVRCKSMLTTKGGVITNVRAHTSHKPVRKEPRITADPMEEEMACQESNLSQEIPKTEESISYAIKISRVWPGNWKEQGF